DDRPALRLGYRAIRRYDDAAIEASHGRGAHRRGVPDAGRIPGAGDVHRAIRGPPPRPVHDVRVVVRHIDDVRISRLHDDLAVLRVDLLVLVALQVAARLRAGAKLLHRRLDIRAVHGKRLAEVGDPLRALAHA